MGYESNGGGLGDSAELQGGGPEDQPDQGGAGADSVVEEALSDGSGLDGVDGSGSFPVRSAHGDELDREIKWGGRGGD